MDVIDRITDYLDGNGVGYRLIDHAPAGSAEEYHAELGTRYEQQAKALFLRVKRQKQKSFAIVALQAQKRADLGRAAGLLQASEVRLATADQLLDETGCRFGELPPFGSPFDVPLLLDRELLEEPEIYFNIGDLSRSMVLEPSVLVALEDPILY
jgi:Ala-tRNA(Pro) deacylase